MKTKQGVAHLAVAFVSIDPRFRSNHPSDTRSTDGKKRGWYYWEKSGRVFIDDAGWMWGRDCKIRLVKVSKSPAPKPMRHKGELASTPQRWNREASKIGFKP